MLLPVWPDPDGDHPERAERGAGTGEGLGADGGLEAGGRAGLGEWVEAGGGAGLGDWVESGEWPARLRRLGPLRYSDLGRRRLAPPGAGPGGPGALAGWLAGSADRWWDEQDRPDPFTLVVESGDDGRLARAVLDARPACAPALRYVLVDPGQGDPAVPPEAMSARVALEQPAFLYPSAATGPGAGDPDGDGSERPPATGIGPLCTFLGQLPALGEGAGAVVAVQALSRLAYDVYALDAGGGWQEVRVGAAGGSWIEVDVALDRPPVGVAGAAAGRVVRWSGALGWLRDVLAGAPGATVAVVESTPVAGAGLFAQLGALRPPTASGITAAGGSLSVLEWRRAT